MSQIEVADVQSIEDRPLLFYPSLRPLQSLASARIATLLWRHKIDYSNTWDYSTLSWFHDQRFSSGDLLPVPTAIRDIIDQSIEQLVKQVESWVRKYSRSIFRGSEDHEIISKCIDSIDVHDDDEAIVSKLLVSGKLTSTEKYRLACKFFRKSDIERLWPSVSRNRLIVDVTLEDDDVIYYWNCKMKGITPQIPGNREHSIYLRLMSYRHPYNNEAMKYVWDKLSLDERSWIVTNVNEILTRARGCEKIMLTLLSKLNKMQILNVLDSIAAIVAETLALDVRNFEYMVQIWTSICEFASVNQLFAILREIYRLAFFPNFPDPLFFEEGFQASEVLYELWIRSPKKLRSYVFDNKVESFFDDLYDIESIRLSVCYYRDMKFFLDLLANLDLPQRTRIWRDNWHLFIIRAKPIYLERLMNLCFETGEDIVRFKEDVMMDYDEIDFVAENFVNFGYCDELSEYIEFCSFDRNKVENLRRRIIAAQFVGMGLFDTEKVPKFVKFIDETFESTELAAQFKEEFLMSPECTILEQLYDALEKGQLGHVINIRYFLSSENCLNRVREECLEHCRSCLVNTKFNDFNVNIWREFITWCCAGSREKWWAFRRSLPITHIFDQLLAKIIKRIYSSFNDGDRFRNRSLAEIISNFTLLDNFLLWCYVQKDIVRNFKVNTLKNGSSRTLTITMGKDWGKIRDIVLNWVCDNDEKMSDEFKASWKTKQDMPVSNGENTK